MPQAVIPLAYPSLADKHRPALRLHLLGPVEAWGLGGEATTLPRGRKARALLGMLGISGSRPVPRARLADLLWSRGDDVTARTSLRQCLRELQITLASAAPNVLLADRDTVTLRHAWIDVAQLSASVATGGCPTDAVLDLAARGPLLADLDGLDPNFDAWLGTERSRLRGQVETLAERCLAAAQAESPERLAATARRVIGLDPASEAAWRALMRAHLARGERGLALRAFQDCRAALREALDVEPSEETAALAKEPGRAAAPAQPSPAAAAPRPPPSRAGVRVAVLPPRILGAGVEDFLPVSLAEEVADALARFRWLFVLSPLGLGEALGMPRGAVGLRAAYGVDYALDGTLARTADDGLRLTFRLLDLAQDGEIVWSRRIERREADPAAALRDDLAAEVVARIDPVILLIESRRAIRRPVGSADAYGHMLRALPLLWRFEREGYALAGEHLASAVALDPDCAPAHAWLAFWSLFGTGQGWAAQAARAAARERAEALAERAMALDPEDAFALTVAGHVRAFVRGRVEEGRDLHERALALNPNLAAAWAFSAAAACYLGQYQDALRRMERYRRLAPLDAQAAFFEGVYTIAHVGLQDWQAAVVAAERMRQLNPGFTNARKLLAAALAQLGDIAGARAIVRELLVLEPGFTTTEFLRAYPLRDATLRERLREGLRRAGAPMDRPSPPPIPPRKGNAR